MWATTPKHTRDVIARLEDTDQQQNKHHAQRGKEHGKEHIWQHSHSPRLPLGFGVNVFVPCVLQ
jgi:hypothetical protein